MSTKDPSGMISHRWWPTEDEYCTLKVSETCPYFKRYTFGDCWLKFGLQYAVCVVCCECVLCYRIFECKSSPTAWCEESWRMQAYECVVSCGGREGPKPVGPPSSFPW